MDNSKKSRNDHGENKKMLIKIGAGAGAGIGAVVLLGGALATAALASFFAVRRSAGEEHRSRGQNSKIEKDEADIRFVNLCGFSGREEEAKEDDGTIKINYAQSLKLDDKAMVETDAAISDDGFVIIKKEIPFLDEKNKDDYSHDTSVDMDKKEVEGFCNGNGEMNATEKGKVDLSGDDIQEAIVVSENTLLPLFEGQQDHVDGDDEEGDDVELLRVDEAIQEDDVEYIEEKTAEESDAGIVHKLNLDAGIVPKQDLAGELGEVGVGLEVCENNIPMQFEARKNVDVEIARDGEAPQEAEEELIKKKSDCSVKDLNDEAALSSVRRGDSSNWEALWQAELPQLIKYEVGGKIQEDKYAVELGRVKDYPTNSMRWRMIVWTISVLSSLSCSWFFNLSVAKLCLVVFLTAFLLEIYGYSLLNRQHAHCLLAAEEDHKKPSNKLANL